MGEEEKAVMVSFKESHGKRSIHVIEQAEKLTSRDRHELIQTEIREAIRDTVSQFGGQWVTVHDVVKLAKLRFPDMEPYFDNKSTAEYLKFMVMHRKLPTVFYKCVPRSIQPIPILGDSQTQMAIYDKLWTVIEDFNGHWMTAQNISHLACAKYPDMRGNFRPKSVAEYLKFMALTKKEIKTTLYFCGTP